MYKNSTKNNFIFTGRLINIITAAVFLLASSLILLSNPVAAMTMPGVNGGKILFTKYSSQSGPSDVFSVNSDGSGAVANLTNMTGEQRAIYPSYSPDGKKIIYTVSADFSTAPYSIWTMNSDGSNKQQLSLPGNSRQASFSPSGKKIVLLNDNSGSYQVSIANIDGSGLSVLSSTQTPSAIALPQWTPDGQAIFYTDSSEDLRSINVDNSNDHLITNNAAGVTVSPDGAKIMYNNTTTTGNYFVVNSDGSGSPLQVGVSGGTLSAAWSPQGDKIIFKDISTSPSILKEVDVGSNTPTTIGSGVTTGDVSPFGAEDYPLAWQPLVSDPVANTDTITATSGKAIGINVIANDSEQYGSVDSSTVKVTGGPSHGSYTVNSVTGVISYTSDKNFVGSDSFTYEVCATYNNFFCDSATVNITVKSPAASANSTGSNSSVLPDTGLNIGAVDAAGYLLVIAGFLGFSLAMFKKPNPLRR